MDDASTDAVSRSGRPVLMAESVILGVFFLTALSLRPQLVGIGPLVGSIQAELHLSHAAAGLLSTIPVLCMGLFAPIAALLAASVGTTAGIATSLLLIGGFGFVRSLAQDPVQISTLTLGVGVGMGVGGALLPVVVKERLGHRPLAGTIAYSSGVQMGAAAGAALAVPISLVLGGWRGALATFSIATILLVVPWLIVVTTDRGRRPGRIALARVGFGDRRGWLLAAVFALFGTIYYGFIAWLADAYVERGWSAAAAGGLVGLLNGASLVGAISVGAIAGRMFGQTAAFVVLGIGFAVSPLAFAALPEGAPAWAALAGYTNGALFPLMLALPVRLVGSPDKVAGLSSIMLGGYAIAALGPIALGAIRDVTGSFQSSLVALAVVGAVFAVGIVRLARWRVWSDPG